VGIGSYYIGKKHELSLQKNKQILLEKPVFLATLEEMQTRDTKRKNDLAIIQQALEAYYRQYGNYPYILANSTDSLWRRNLKEELGDYLEEIPVDPINNKVYYYLYDGSLDRGQSYVLSTFLENPTDPEGPNYTVYGGYRAPAHKK